LEAPYRPSRSNPLAMGRDPTHQPRVLQAPSSLGLSAAREGEATAFLGNLGQGLTILRAKNFFLVSDLNLPAFSLKPSPLVLSLRALVTSPSPALSQPLQALAAALRCPCSLLFSRLNNPSSPSLSSQQRCKSSCWCEIRWSPPRSLLSARDVLMAWSAPCLAVMGKPIDPSTAVRNRQFSGPEVTAVTAGTG